MSTIGIVAGMGPRSTGPFIDLVLDACQSQYGAVHDIDFPRMLVLSLPAPFWPDRPVDHAAMEAALLGGVRQLADAGADCIAIACNTAHAYHPQLAAALDVPLLNMVELATAALPPTAHDIALVAARPTVESGIYQRSLVDRGLCYVDLDGQDEIDRLLDELRTTPRGTADPWPQLAARARGAGADGLIIACADLTTLTAAPDIDLPVVDSTRVLAEEIVVRERESWS